MRSWPRRSSATTWAERPSSLRARPSAVHVGYRDLVPPLVDEVDVRPSPPLLGLLEQRPDRVAAVSCGLRLEREMPRREIGRRSRGDGSIRARAALIDE